MTHIPTYTLTHILYNTCSSVVIGVGWRVVLGSSRSSGRSGIPVQQPRSRISPEQTLITLIHLLAWSPCSLLNIYSRSWPMTLFRLIDINIEPPRHLIYDVTLSEHGSVIDVGFPGKCGWMWPCTQQAFLRFPSVFVVCRCWSLASWHQRHGDTRLKKSEQRGAASYGLGSLFYNPITLQVVSSWSTLWIPGESHFW